MIIFCFELIKNFDFAVELHNIDITSVHAQADVEKKMTNLYSVNFPLPPLSHRT